MGSRTARAPAEGEAGLWGWVAVDSIRTLGWSEGWAPQPAGASSPLGDCSDRGATGKARLRGL